MAVLVSPGRYVLQAFSSGDTYYSRHCRFFQRFSVMLIDPSGFRRFRLQRSPRPLPAHRLISRALASLPLVVFPPQSPASILPADFSHPIYVLPESITLAACFHL